MYAHKQVHSESFHKSAIIYSGERQTDLRSYCAFIFHIINNVG